VCAHLKEFIQKESVNNGEIMLPEAVEGGLCSESVNRGNKAVEVVCKAVNSVSEFVQCEAVTRSQAKAELNYRGLKPLLVAISKIVDSEILKTEQKKHPTLFKYWELAKKFFFEKQRTDLEVSYLVKKDILYRVYK